MNYRYCKCDCTNFYFFGKCVNLFLTLHYSPIFLCRLLFFYWAFVFSLLKTALYIEVSFFNKILLK